MEQLANQQAEETIRIAAGLAIKNSLSAKVRIRVYISMWLEREIDMHYHV